MSTLKCSKATEHTTVEEEKKRPVPRCQDARSNTAMQRSGYVVCSREGSREKINNHVRDFINIHIS
jgi:hypothetical protein